MSSFQKSKPLWAKKQPKPKVKKILNWIFSGFTEINEVFTSLFKLLLASFLLIQTCECSAARSHTICSGFLSPLPLHRVALMTVCWCPCRSCVPTSLEMCCFCDWSFVRAHVTPIDQTCAFTLDAELQWCKWLPEPRRCPNNVHKLP